jgi:hypothetical protein
MLAVSDARGNNTARQEVEYLAELTTKKRGRESSLPVVNF